MRERERERGREIPRTYGRYRERTKERGRERPRNVCLERKA